MYSSGREARHSPGYTFSRSYSANLPSSLTRGLSSALEFSSGPPVSVCGTSVNNNRVRSFSWKHGIGELLGDCPLHRTSETRDDVCRCRVLSSLPTCLNRKTSHPAHLTFSVPTDAQTRHWRCRNINLLSIDYAFRPRLRSRLTRGGKSWPRKPWAYGERVSHTFCRYSCQHLLLKSLHTVLSIMLLSSLQCSPTTPERAGVRSFGTRLEPR